METHLFSEMNNKKNSCVLIKVISTHSPVISIYKKHFFITCCLSNMTIIFI